MDKHQCNGIVYGSGSWGRGRQCNANGSLEYEGKHYCKTHHPPTVKAKRDARNAAFEAKLQAQHDARKAQASQDAEVKRRASLYDELLDALCWYVETDEVNDSPENEFWLKGRERAKAVIAKAKGAE